MPEPSRLKIEVLDIVVEVVLHGEAAEAETRMRPAWARCLADTKVPANTRIEVRLDSHAVPRRSHTHVVAPTLDALMELCTQAITLAGITAGAGRLLMLHAAGLVDAESGRGVLLVGPSGIGKSTAARRLGQEWGYLSDETMAIRPDGTVIAYPKPLSLREGGRWKRQASPDSLGLLAGPTPTSLAGVLLLDRRKDSAAEVYHLPLTEAVAALAEHTSYLAAVDRPLRRLSDVVATSGCARVVYSSTEQLQVAVRAVFRGDALCV